MKKPLSIVKHYLLAVLLVLIATSAYASENAKSIKEVYVDLEAEQASFLEIISLLEAKTIYKFHYSKSDIAYGVKITKVYKKASVAAILSDLAKAGNLKFRQINYDISVNKLSKRTPEEPLVEVEVQSITVSITVLDEGGSPLPGVNIVEKGNSNGTITDALGKATIEVAEDATLQLSYIGYKSQEIAIAGRTSLQVDMQLDQSQLNELVVVGSRNQNRTVLETPVPIDIIAVEDIVKSAPQIEVGQILNYVAPSFSSNQQTIADGSDHIDPASLRGLGVDHVLVLINGKRRHASSLVNVNGSVGRGSVGTDLNTIPAAAIKRIEVLRDGASAQYGSDAIAGVINIVLKDATDEVYLSATQGQLFEGDGAVTQFNVNYGFNVGENGFINLTGQYQSRGRTDRGGVFDGDVYRTSWNGTSRSIYAENFQEGDYSPFDVGNKLSAQEAIDINNQNAFTNNLTDAEQEALINANGGREAFSMKVGQSEVQNTALMLNSVLEIDEGKELYFFGGLNSRTGQATGFYRLPNQSRTLSSVYPNGFLPEINSQIFDASLTGGLRGEISGWNVDFSNTFGTNAFTYLITNTHNASRGNSTPTSFNAGGFRFSQNTTNLDFNRYFDDIMSGINVAFGAEYRVDTYEIFAGEEGSYRNYGNVNVIDTTNAGNPFSNEFNQTNIFYDRPGGAQVFPGFQPSNELKESRSNISVYWDTEFNFSPSFFIDVAARFEDYSDFGSTVNGKIAARLKVTEALAIRGSTSTGFRAPSLQQRYFNSTSTLFQLNSEGVNVPNEVGTFRNDSRIAELFGIPSLDNETSVNFSAGITWAILENLNLTLDGYFVKIDDRVALTGSFSSSSSEEIAEILDEANAGSATFFVNGIDTETKGVDVILTHNAQIGTGSLKTSLAANFTETQVTDVKIPPLLQGAASSFFNREEQNRFEDAMPQSKINLALVYSIGRFTAYLTNVRFGEVYGRTDNTDADGNLIDQKFDAKIITDLSLGFDITDNINLTIGANNLLDVYPDENRSEFRSNERFVYSRRVSQFGFNGGFYFARLNLTF